MAMKLIVGKLDGPFLARAQPLVKIGRIYSQRLH